MATFFLALCDFCMEAHQFTSQEARDGWELEHQARHDEEVAE